jgi:hypothetical protein
MLPLKRQISSFLMPVSSAHTITSFNAYRLSRQQAGFLAVLKVAGCDALPASSDRRAPATMRANGVTSA